MEDKDIIKQVWEGRLPVCFTLADEDVYVVEPPDSFYLMVPRQTYFPLVTEKIQRYFLKFVDTVNSGELWLDYEGIPLKWHYPIGVLFDFYVKDAIVPWNITVHFRNFPTDDLLFCHSKDVVEAHFMSVIKEADSLKHRASVINNMQKKDHKQLWSALINDKCEQFWTINRKLMENTGDLTFRHIPFRIYLPEKPVVQMLVRPYTEAGDQRCLGDLLREALPNIFASTSDPAAQVIIQGITVPTTTPLIWLSTNFSYPDNFLHMTILNTNVNTSEV